jgi:hypothetical protein
VGAGGVQAVCPCGCRSPVFGADKTIGTMDPLQRSAESEDLDGQVLDRTAVEVRA